MKIWDGFLMGAVVLSLAAMPACKDDGGDGDDDAGGDDVMADDGPVDDGMMDAGDGPTLYERLGGEQGITEVVNHAVGRILADPAINGYFLNADLNPMLGPCLVKQIGSLTGGPQTYPDPAMGCRDMRSAHDGLGISTDDFLALAGHFQGTLTDAGVAPEDVDTVIGVLADMAPEIVEDEEGTASVYHRVGGKTAIQAVIGDFIGRVVANAEINGFFGGVDADRLSTCLVRQVCSIDGPCHYGQEVDSPGEGIDPGVSASAPCLDMASSHQGLLDDMDNPITIDDFNALALDLVAALDAAGVAPEDRDALVGVIGGLCPDIVDGGEGCG